MERILFEGVKVVTPYFCSYNYFGAMCQLGLVSLEEFKEKFRVSKVTGFYTACELLNPVEECPYDEEPIYVMVERQYCYTDFKV